MRRPEYLSPNSMSKWAKDPNEYYLTYLSDNRPDKQKQNLDMAVGSAFDAYVKAFLHERIFGKGTDPRFDLDTIFEEQVEPQNRDYARNVGDHLLGQYRRLGALDDLMLALGRSKGPPRFEMDIRGTVNSGHSGTVRGVPFRVRPDLCFVNEHDAVVVFDWKVNGYRSASGVSPMKGFVKARRSGKMPWAHDDARLGSYKGMTVNIGSTLEELNEEWARQVSVGAWVFGQPVGAKFVACIHQLACRSGNVTVAEHVTFVSPAYQEKLHDQAATLWRDITSDHVFRHLSFEDSKEMCRLLDQRKETLAAGQGSINPFE